MALTNTGIHGNDSVYLDLREDTCKLGCGVPLVVAVNDGLRKGTCHTMVIEDDLIGHNSHVGTDRGMLPQRL